MKQLQSLQTVEIINGIPKTTSLKVAEIFDKRHDDVLKSIRNLGCSEEFGLRNFAESSYLNEQNKSQPMYEITKDGFTLLVMGYTGEKAMQFKEAYIAAFNNLESNLLSLHRQIQNTRSEVIKSITDFSLEDLEIEEVANFSDLNYILKMSFPNVSKKHLGYYYQVLYACYKQNVKPDALAKVFGQPKYFIRASYNSIQANERREKEDAN